MKTRGWLLLAAMVLCWATAVQPFSAQGTVAVQLSHPLPQAPSRLGHGTGTSAINCPGAVLVTFPSATLSSRKRTRSTPVIRALDPQPDDDGQANDDSSSDTNASLAFSELVHIPAEWWLIQPDTRFANSFIHSKFKPPP